MAAFCTFFWFNNIHFHPLFLPLKSSTVFFRKTCRSISSTTTAPFAPLSVVMHGGEELRTWDGEQDTVVNSFHHIIFLPSQLVDCMVSINRMTTLFWTLLMYSLHSVGIFISGLRVKSWTRIIALKDACLWTDTTFQPSEPIAHDITVFRLMAYTVSTNRCLEMTNPKIVVFFRMAHLYRTVGQHSEHGFYSATVL